MSALRRTRLLRLALTALALHVTSATFAAGDTLLRTTSDAGDPVGGGQKLLLAPPASAFTVSTDFSGLPVNFSVAPGTHQLKFVGPAKRVLRPGHYFGATRPPSLLPYTPGIDVYLGVSGCSQTAGSFHIRQLSRDAQNKVTAFWATFEQQCDGSTAKLKGELRWNADTSLYVDSPADVFTSPRKGVHVDVQGVETRGRPLTLHAFGLPAGATFSDHGDGTGAFDWPAGSPLPAQYTVEFFAVNDLGDSAFAYTVLDAFRPDLFHSAPDGAGDNVSRQVTWTDTPANRPFETHTPGGTTQEIRYNGGGHRWILQFGPPAGLAMTPGVYAAAYNLNLPDSGPVMSITQDEQGCPTSTGTFEVRRFEANPDNSLKNIWVTWLQRCEGSATGILGELRIDADTSIYVTAPAVVHTWANRPVNVSVSVHTVGAGPIHISASGTPSGATFADHGDGTASFQWPSGPAGVGDIPVRFTATDASLDTAFAVTTIRTSPVNLLRYSSTATNPVGLGGSALYTNADGDFYPGVTYGQYSNFGFQGSGHWWTIDSEGTYLRPPRVGTYTGASDLDAGYPNQPALSVLGDNRRGTRPTGTVHVRKIDYNGSTLNSLWATFEQHSDHGLPPSIIGEVRFNADTSVYADAPADVYTLTRSPVEFAVIGVDTRGYAVSLTADALPPGAVFNDHHDGTAEFAWASPDLAEDSVWVRFTAWSAHGDSASCMSLIHISEPLELVLVSPTGDPIGGGSSVRYGSGDGAFDGRINADSTITVTFSGSGHNYSLTFNSADGRTPSEGWYSTASNYPPQASPYPWIVINGDGQTCSSNSGDFRILRVQQLPGGVLDSFWAQFHHQCGGAPPLQGEVHFSRNQLVSVATTLQSIDAVSTGIRIRWWLSAAGGSIAVVQRRTLSADWTDLEARASDGSGYVEYMDSTVVAGRRYGYRLAIRSEAGTNFVGEAWATAADVGRLAIDLDGPNPIVGPVVASFTLPVAGPARLLVLDIFGRARIRRDIPQGTAGRHTLWLVEGSSLPAGCYFVTIEAQGRRASRKLVVMR